MMNRFLTSCFSLVFAASLAASSIFGPLSIPVYAQTAVENQTSSSIKAESEPAATEAREAPQSTSDKKDKKTGSSKKEESSETARDLSKATADNPIGEHSAHYNVDGFEESELFYNLQLSYFSKMGI